MKVSVELVLVLFLCVMVEVFSQTAVPYVRFGNIFSNHSYVDLSGAQTSSEKTVQCHTDLTSCCSSLEGADRGDWFFPNGTTLRSNSSGDSLYRSRTAQRVNLHCRKSVSITNGIYQCTIETNAVNNNAGREKIYVGLYASGGNAQKKLG